MVFVGSLSKWLQKNAMFHASTEKTELSSTQTDYMNDHWITFRNVKNLNFENLRLE